MEKKKARLEFLDKLNDLIEHFNKYSFEETNKEFTNEKHEYVYCVDFDIKFNINFIENEEIQRMFNKIKDFGIYFTEDGLLISKRYELSKQ